MTNGDEFMYYPLLRGRQNELLAIKELLDASALSSKIVPVIEPVKLSPTLVNTLSAFSAAKHPIILIRNPSVGSFGLDCKSSKNRSYLEKLKVLLADNDLLQRGLIIGSKSPSTFAHWKANGISEEDVVALCLKPDDVKYYEETFGDVPPQKTMVPYASAFRRIRKNRILLDNKFNKKLRNKDYADDEDEFFSEDHLFFEQDNYVGFSDYSIVGDEYVESGFAPYAVAIHIVYFDKDNVLRIHHFISKDNEDISDPANKFYQALQQLVEWNKQMQLNTIAMRKFKEIYQNETYPGLGMVKRLSIMHHIELMGKFLDGDL